jgi:hypothetical protein
MKCESSNKSAFPLLRFVSKHNIGLSLGFDVIWCLEFYFPDAELSTTFRLSRPIKRYIMIYNDISGGDSMNNSDVRTKWQLEIEIKNSRHQITSKRKRHPKCSNIGYIRRRKTKQKHNTICVGHHYTEANTSM